MRRPVAHSYWPCRVTLPYAISPRSRIRESRNTASCALTTPTRDARVFAGGELQRDPGLPRRPGGAITASMGGVSECPCVRRHVIGGWRLVSLCGAKYLPLHALLRAKASSTFIPLHTLQHTHTHPISSRCLTQTSSSTSVSQVPYVRTVFETMLTSCAYLRYRRLPSRPCRMWNFLANCDCDKY